jgi:5-hydroxyisourate hydrolase-like protein (transthyretin family)
MTVKAAKLLALGIVLWTMGAHATIRVVQKKVSVSRALAGHVAVLGTEEPASGVTVGLCSPDWKKIIATTKTDDEGHFSLEKLANTRLFYLRVSAPGMDIYQLRVRIEKHAAEELKIHLSVAT